MLKVEAALEAQQEARDRQADAFGSAVSQIELANVLLALFLAVVGIFTAVLATRWFRDSMEKLMKRHVNEAVGDLGNRVVEASSGELMAKYDEKFARYEEKLAELYQRYEDHVERRQ